MNRSWLFIVIGMLVLFLTMFAPILTLIAWLTSSPVFPFLILALLISIPAFFAFWHNLNKSSNMQLRWCWMQALGLGTVLMSLVIVGSLFTWHFEPFRVAIAVLAGWLILSAFAVWQAVSIKTRYLQFSDTQIAESIRLVQISDIHIGSRSAQFLHKVVDQVNHEKPDLVLITGDLLDASSVGVEELRALSQLSGPVYMCIGNHERYVDLDNALMAIESHGVNILRDSMVSTHGLQLIGIDDRDRPDALPDVLAKLEPDQSAYSVLLYHRPDGWQAALQNNINLTLSGHTHAGQMFPFGLLVKRQYPNMAGVFYKDGKSMNVSVGTGTWGPIFRLGTRSEMTVIDLEQKRVDNKDA